LFGWLLSKLDWLDKLFELLGRIVLVFDWGVGVFSLFDLSCRKLLSCSCKHVLELSCWHLPGSKWVIVLFKLCGGHLPRCGGVNDLISMLELLGGLLLRFWSKYL
jgi:hypothetical protein